MKILVAEDMEELIEIVEMILQGAFPDAQILTALNGEKAIEIIEQEANLTLVISDYNMPKKTGGNVFEALRKQSSEIPFILMSSEELKEKKEFKDAKYTYQVHKPFTDTQILKVVKKALSEAHIEDHHLKIPSPLIPVNIEMVEKIGMLSVPLFIKLADQNFVKVLHAGSRFDAVEKDRFIKRNIKQLWVESLQFEMFYSDYKKEILAKIAWDTLSQTELTQHITMDHSMIHAAARNFGWSTELIAHTTQSIKNVIKLSEQHPDIKKLFQEMKSNKNSPLSHHAILLSMFTTHLIKELNWNSKMTSEKLVFASILHDINLSEELFTTMITVLLNSNAKDFESNHSPEFKLIREHPLVIAELLSHWQLCPPDVDVIIRQHHEQPDGNGFPKGLKSLQISPLAAVLIVAEDVLFHWNENQNSDPKNYLLSRKDFYNHGEFKNIYEAALKSLSTK